MKCQSKVRAVEESGAGRGTSGCLLNGRPHCAIKLAQAQGPEGTEAGGTRQEAGVGRGRKLLRWSVWGRAQLQWGGHAKQVGDEVREEAGANHTGRYKL